MICYARRENTQGHQASLPEDGEYGCEEGISPAVWDRETWKPISAQQRKNFLTELSKEYQLVLEDKSLLSVTREVCSKASANRTKMP